MVRGQGALVLFDSSKARPTWRLHPSLDLDQLIDSHWLRRKRANVHSSVGVTQRRGDSLLYKQMCVFFAEEFSATEPGCTNWCFSRQIAVSQGYLSLGLVAQQELSPLTSLMR